MRILYSCLSLSWGGMEMFTITAAEKLVRRGIATDILCLENSRIHKACLEKGLSVHTLKSGGSFAPLSVYKLIRILRNGNYSLVHTQASKDLWLLVPALKATGSRIPLFLTKQVGSYIKKKDILHKFLYNRVTVAFAISEIIRRNLLDTCPLTEEKIELLHNGTDTRKFDPVLFDKQKVRNELCIPPDCIVLGMLARFSPGKGHEEFIEAAAELSARHLNLFFLIVGEASRGEEEYAASVKNLAEAKSISNMIFTGFRSDTPDVLAALDIFVFPSHSEAFGIALVEAMSMGKPAVCSNSDGILDIVVDGETGLLFEKKNSGDLAQKLEKLILSHGTRNTFGANARKRAVEMFDMEYLTDKVIKIYKNHLG
ncbi:MAG: glycosyltransferase family 4 protein [Ignavibacteriaceae bacterium]|nr:glycosyltransferase family 4 protein [Ignavibacteriaceae bacterium]